MLEAGNLRRGVNWIERIVARFIANERALFLNRTPIVIAPLMLSEFPVIARNTVSRSVPLYNPNMSRGTFPAAEAGLARPISSVSPKVCL